MWDEFVIGGDVQETSKKNVLKAISDQDLIQEVRLFVFVYSIIQLISKSPAPFSLLFDSSFRKN